MFTIDFTKPFLYKDIIYFNQGNLAANNILRCKLTTGGDETLEGYIATVTFKTLSNPEINESVNIVDVKNCIVDIKFPSNALEVGVNELEVILTKGEGIDKVVTPSPIIKYEVWQCITTGNGIQGDNNYPILIDLISDVNNAVRIANNASATADASLKQTAKMLEVVNTNIAKANIAIDNTNSAKDEALNAVEEVNSAKDNLVSEVNAAKNSMIEDVNSTKESVLSDISATKQNVIADTNKAIKKMNNDFEALTASQQQDAEVILARDGEKSLNARLERDLAKGKIIYETVEDSYINTNDTLDSYLQNVEIKGNTIQNPNDLADIKSVGDKVGEQELYKIPIVCTGVNLLNPNSWNLNTSPNASGELVSQNDRATTDFIRVDRSKKISRFLNGGHFNNVYCYDKDKIYLGNVYNQNTVTLKDNTVYIRVNVVMSATDLSIFGICYSDTVVNNVPYQEHKITILSPTQIEKVGDVEDRIVEKDGVWGVEKNVVTIKFKDATGWRLQNWGDNSVEHQAFMYDVPLAKNYGWDTNSELYLICDRFEVKSIIGEVEAICRLQNNTVIALKLNKSNASNFEELSEYIKRNNFFIKIALNESQFIPLPHSQQVKLKTFANKTNISFLTEIEGTIKADVAKSISASVNSNTQEISDLWDFVLKNNLANFAVALNTLDTKLKLEQLTKVPR